MKLVEPAIYKFLLDEGVEETIYIGYATPPITYPLILIQRINTESIHNKDQDAVHEDVILQITCASNESLLLANDMSVIIHNHLTSVSSELINVAPSQSITIKEIWKDNDTYVFDEVNEVHNIHTDYRVVV